MLPARNQPDLDEVPDDVLKDLEIHFVTKIEEALPYILIMPDKPLPAFAP